MLDTAPAPPDDELASVTERMTTQLGRHLALGAEVVANAIENPGPWRVPAGEDAALVLRARRANRMRELLSLDR